MGQSYCKRLTRQLSFDKKGVYCTFFLIRLNEDGVIPR